MNPEGWHSLERIFLWFRLFPDVIFSLVAVPHSLKLVLPVHAGKVCGGSTQVDITVDPVVISFHFKGCEPLTFVFEIQEKFKTLFYRKGLVLQFAVFFFSNL